MRAEGAKEAEGAEEEKIYLPPLPCLLCFLCLPCSKDCLPISLSPYPQFPCLLFPESE